MAKPCEKANYLQRNAVELLPEGELEKKLRLSDEEGRGLRVKLGIDPTAPDIHLGHTVVLQKLREFQDLGHRVVLIIGDYTARVGEPSGRSEARRALDGEEIVKNSQTCKKQAFKVLDIEKTEVRLNSEWLDMKMDELFKLARSVTIAQVIERDDFETRFKEGKPISLLEMLYPLLQGYDSVAVEADVELGGTDQKFNLLMGRQLQQTYGQPQQAIMTMPILPGTDGHLRMSKSTGNYIGVTESPEEMFGKVMSIPDEIMPIYFELLVGDDDPDISNPNEAKRSLGRMLVARFSGDDEAKRAEEHFDRLHKEKRAPEQVEEEGIPSDLIADGKVHLPALMANSFDISRCDARRMIAQGGVRIDGQPLSEDELDVDMERLDGAVLKAGKRRFVRYRSTA